MRNKISYFKQAFFALAKHYFYLRDEIPMKNDAKNPAKAAKVS